MDKENNGRIFSQILNTRREIEFKFPFCGEATFGCGICYKNQDENIVFFTIGGMILGIYYILERFKDYI